MTDFEQQLEAAKLDAMAEFAAGAGHEINNPIAVIVGRAQLLLRDETDPQRRRELAVINTQAMRVYEMIADMMLFARPPSPKMAPCDLAVIARQIVDELSARAAERCVSMHLEVPEEPVAVDGDANQLSIAVRALCDNALAAVERGGNIHVRVRTVQAGSGAAPTIALSISDDGRGITPEVRPHIFDPFFSGRQAGRGLGMGLAKAWRIVQNHHGHIEVTSEPAEGATFSVVLPAGT